MEIIFSSVPPSTKWTIDWDRWVNGSFPPQLKRTHVPCSLLHSNHFHGHAHTEFSETIVFIIYFFYLIYFYLINRKNWKKSQVLGPALASCFKFLTKSE